MTRNETRRQINVPYFVVGVVLSIVTCSVVLTVGIGFLANIQSDMPSLTGVAAMANQTAYTTFNNVYSAFSLTTMLPIIGIAALVIFLIIATFRFELASGAFD